MNLPINSKLIKRSRYTEPQTLTAVSLPLSKEALLKLDEKYPSELQRQKELERLIRKEKVNKRQKNIQGAFELRQNVRISQNIILVDDVWTTGATMQECCRVLKTGGAKRVWGVTLLRAN